VAWSRFLKATPESKDVRVKPKPRYRPQKIREARNFGIPAKESYRQQAETAQEIGDMDCKQKGHR
jgi:hypothetical protein